MSRLPSIDDYWNSYESRKPSISAYRGMAAEGSATNDMGFWGYAGDVAQAVPRGIWGAADSISEMIYYGTGGFLGNTEREAPFGIEALRGPSQTTAGGLVEGISQIAVPYGAGLKVTRAATGLLGLRGAGTAATAALGEEAVIAAAAGQRGRAALLAATSRGIEVGKMAAEGTVAGAIGDFIGFSSWAPRLSDLAVQSDNPLFNNALTQYLASDEDDSFLEGRLKNTIEGVFASGAVESVLGAARVVRAGQRAARIGTDANAAMFAEHMKIRRGHREQIMGATGATADEAELINMVVDATGMSRDRLSFAREAIQEFDEAGKPRRAAVDFYEDGKTVIRFFETADRTSPVHELSHVIRRRVLDRRIDPSFRMGMTDTDIKVIEDYVGAKNGEFDVAAEENWAQLFERFMWDGIAPNRSVAAVMERSAEFMRSVYSRVQADELLRSINPEEWAANGGTAGLKINDDVRQVMNKLMSRAPVTTTEAIRTFGKAQKRLAIMGNGRLYRTVLSAANNSLNPNEAVEAFDSVYREETLYQSAKKKKAEPQGPVSAAKRVGAKVTDANYPVQRGRRAIIDRLRREVSQGELKAEDAERMQQLIEKLPPELMDVMGVRFRLSTSLSGGKYGATLGEFDYGRSVVAIASDMVRGGGVRETWAHEWGHAMSSFLDETVVNQLRQDYTRAYQKFIRLEGVDPRAQKGTPEFDALKKWSAANPARWADVYSLTTLDEYLAVGFQSRSWKQLDIQEGTRSFIGFSRYMFHNLMLNIKSLWGGALHDRIARDLLDADFRQAKRNRMEFLKRFGFDKYKPNAKRPGMIADESNPFGDWEYRLDQQIRSQSKFWFRDFDIAENARTVGEKKSESLQYRDYNKLDENLEMRSGLTGTTVPKQPTKTVTLYQSTPEFKSWFKESKVTDAEGNPRVVEHQTNAAFDTFEGGEFGFHIGTDLPPGMMGQNTMKLYASLQNPLRMKDLGVWDADNVVAALRGSGKFATARLKKELNAAYNAAKALEADPNYERLRDEGGVEGAKAHYAASAPFRDLLKKQGFDSIVYKNESEGLSDSWIAFDANQLKSIDNKAPTSNPSTLFQSMQPGSPQYTKALEGTKAVDEAGAPVKVFHGTPMKGVKELDPAAAMEVRGATWFSDNSNVAEQYRFVREYGEIVGEEAGDLIEANLVLRNPLEVDYKGKVGDAISLGKLVQKAKAEGYDGLIVRNVDDTVDSSGELGTSYAVFSKEQVVQLPKRETLYQSAAGGQPNLPLPQPPQLSPQGGKPPQRPFNIENMSTADDVRSYHDIRIQELEADGRVQYNSMDRAEQVAAAEREMMQVADFTGYRTMPELTQALKADEDALQGFMAKHLATRMILSEAAGQLIQAREAALISGSKQDMARFVAMQQRVDVLLEHTRRNQAAVARGLGSQNIVPGPGIGVVRLVDDTMLNDPKMVDDIIDAAGGDGAIKEAMERSRLAETRGGQSGAVRATQGGRHGIVPVLTEYWMNSILSGPITFAVNATSNTAAMLYAPLEQALGASLDKNFPLMRESMMRYGAMVSEVKDAMYYAGAVLKTGDNILDKVAPSGLSGNVSARDRAISAAGFGFADNSKIGAFANFLGTVVNAPGTALSATDEFFKQLNYRSTVKAGLLADAMQEVAAGRLTKDQMGQFVETRFQRMVEDGQFYAEKKIRADANNAAAAEIKAGTFSQGSADHLNFIKKYMKDNWNAADGELAKRARETAREATFTTALRSDRAGLEGISAKVQTLVGQHPSLRILIPFVRTPTNLALYFGQRLPISGVMYNIPHLNEVGTRFQRDITSGDPVRRAQALGRMSGGTLITMSALIAAGTGIITGSGPKDPEERAYLMKSGWQPYSFKVGNTYISYRKMDPFATFFGVAADLHEAYANSDDENKGIIETTLKGLVAAVANNIANKTYLTGLVRASNAISDAERYGADWLEQTVASFVPSLLSQSKDIFGMDPVMRDVQTISEAIRNRIPGLSEGVAPRRDVLGEPMRRAEIMGAVPMAWPFAYSKVSNDIIAQELAQLGAGFTPPRAMRNDVDLRAYVNRRGQNSYDRWQELTGQVRLGGKTLREAMEQLIRTPSYQKIDPTSVEGYESPRVGMIRKLISRYRDAAFRTTLKEFPDLMEAERHRRATVIGASSGKPFAQLLQYSRGR